MSIATPIQAAEALKPDLLAETIVSKIANPATSLRISTSLHGAVNDVLKDVGLTIRPIAAATSLSTAAIRSFRAPIGLAPWPRSG